MSDFIVINGQITPDEDAHISPFDAGLLHGAGLFETLRVCNGVTLNLQDHLDRLTESGRCCGMDIQLDCHITSELIAELLEANALADARVRITVTRGDTRTAEMQPPEPTVLISAAAFHPYPAELYDKGMTVIIARYCQNPMGPLTGHKTISYMDRLMALREARAAQAGESLWFTHPEKHLAEGCVSNVFIVEPDGQIATPPWQWPTAALVPPAAATDGFMPRLALPGITRRHILRLGVENNLPTVEKMLTIHDVLAAREIWLTNAIMGVMPVTHVERHAVGDEKPGPVFRQFAMLYENFIQEQSHGKKK